MMMKQNIFFMDAFTIRVYKIKFFFVKLKKLNLLLLFLQFLFHLNQQILFDDANFEPCRQLNLILVYCCFLLLGQ